MKRADFPTFGLPTIATLGRRWSGIWMWIGTLATKKVLFFELIIEISKLFISKQAQASYKLICEDELPNSYDTTDVLCSTNFGRHCQSTIK